MLLIRQLEMGFTFTTEIDRKFLCIVSLSTVTESKLNGIFEEVSPLLESLNLFSFFIDISTFT